MSSLYAEQNLRLAQKMLEQQGEINDLKAAIARVRALHSPDAYGDCPACGLSSSEDPTPWDDCETIAALDQPVKESE